VYSIGVEESNLKLVTNRTNPTACKNARSRHHIVENFKEGNFGEFDDTLQIRLSFIRQLLVASGNSIDIAKDWAWIHQS